MLIKVNESNSDFDNEIETARTKKKSMKLKDSTVKNS